jgi:hypothetical protein
MRSVLLTVLGVVLLTLFAAPRGAAADTIPIGEITLEAPSQLTVQRATPRLLPGLPAPNQVREGRVRPGMIAGGIALIVPGAIFTSLGGAGLVWAGVLADSGGWDTIGAVILTVLGIPVTIIGATLLTIGIVLVANARKKYADDDEYMSVRPLHRPHVHGTVAPPPVQGMEVVFRW